MPRATKPSFVTELPLKVDSAQDKELQARFQAARQLYNCCLGEAMTRLKLIRGSEAYQVARQIPKTSKKLRTEAFTKANEAYRYSDYDLQAFASLTAKSSTWIAEKLDAQLQQTIATRAFKTSQRVALSRATKVRFKVASQFKSVEGKTIKQGLRWKTNQVVWCGLVIQPIIDWTNPVIKHGLDSPVKYVRLIRRELNGKRRWFVQLINEGIPYQKPQNKVNTGVVGIDLNISNIAFVADNKAGLLPFAEGVPTFEREIRKLQRQMERSRRATNPDNYEPDFHSKQGNKVVKKKGKLKRAVRQKVKSTRYFKAAQKKRELERRKTAYARSKNRRLVNEILRHGNEIKAEKVSVKGWQKIFGKAISAKSPGFFQSELKRKAESAGGKFIQFSTQKTALSQTHLTGERVKKSLLERVHYDRSGVVMQRDLFSAYLSRYVNQDMLDSLATQDAVNEYPRLESVLVEAWEVFKQTAKRVGESESRMPDSSSERFSTKVGKVSQIANTGKKLTPTPSLNLTTLA